MNRLSLASLLTFLTAFSLLSCASVKSPNDSASTFIRAAATRETDNVRVSAAVLTEAESREYFGRPLESAGVQAIWLKVENRTSAPVWLLPRYADPDYFSPAEVAYRSNSVFSLNFSRQSDPIFQREAISWRVAPGETNVGFLFVNISEGIKYVNVELWSSRGPIDVGFYFELPGGHFDFELTDLATIHPAGEVRDFSLDELRQALEGLACCTSGRKGAYGDPVNVVLIGANDDVFSALVRQGWDPTHALSRGSVGKTIRAFLLGYRYRYSPVSSLFLFDRQQDIAFQKARETVHQRNHMRLWLSPYTYRGKPVWVGQISRDIGIRFTLRSPFLTTHKIDPDVDEARDYLVQDLSASETVEWLGYVNGVGATSPQAPRENLTGDEYFTDGLRAVIALSSGRIPVAKVKDIGWQPLPIH
jgi:hypothetical protein